METYLILGERYFFRRLRQLTFARVFFLLSVRIGKVAQPRNFFHNSLLRKGLRVAPTFLPWRNRDQKIYISPYVVRGSGLREPSRNRLFVSKSLCSTTLQRDT